jgi:hypothetical protein
LQAAFYKASERLFFADALINAFFYHDSRFFGNIGEIMGCGVLNTHGRLLGCRTGGVGLRLGVLRYVNLVHI